ncbi:MAG: radical SAM protein [Candidatus Riflebacteria bacterium]|nr:radical SAM protein [Candidatus Riflebacteria bacterium]
MEEVVPIEPSYLEAYHDGTLATRIELALEHLGSCALCPRRCGVDRLEGETGFCKSGRTAWVSSFSPHMGEEDCLRGWRGSGTIFMTQCSLGCVFCQNYDISHEGAGQSVSPEGLAAMMTDLAEQGCHNINFVSPTHVVPQILEALPHAIREGLSIPLVYNTGGYDSVETLRWLDGIFDIYMPDFKYWDEEKSERHLRARDYPEAARMALREMHRQVGALRIDDSGLATGGVLVRHLVMPGAVEDTRQIMRWLVQELSPDTFVNLMPQYRSAGEVSASAYPEIDRPIAPAEFEEAWTIAEQQGITRFDSRRQPAGRRLFIITRDR